MEKNTRYQIDKYFKNTMVFGHINVLQIGRRFLKPNSKINLHNHLNWYELTVVTRGKCIVVANNIKTEVNEGEIFVSYPYDTHEIITDDNLEYDYYSFNYSNCKEGNILKEITLKKTSDKIIKNSNISSLIGNAILEINTENSLLFNEMLTNTFNLIGIHLIKSLQSIKDDNSNISNAQILCYEIMNYIDSNILSIDNLSNISTALNYNYSYLSYIFKKTTKKTISNYYQNKKFEMAKNFLTTDNYTIVRISEILGYDSPFSFSFAFKRRFNISPQSFKNKFKNK